MIRFTVVSAAEKTSSVLLTLVLSSAIASPQQASNAPQASSATGGLRDLEAQVRELSSSLHEMHAELERSRREAALLRQELRETREDVTVLKEELSGPRVNALGRPADSTATGQGAGPSTSEDVHQRVTKLEEDQELLG